METDPHGAPRIPIGTRVVALDGSPLGRVREVYPHYLLVGEEGEHEELQVPMTAITGWENGRLRVSVNRRALSQVDEVETARHLSHEEET